MLVPGIRTGTSPGGHYSAPPSPSEGQRLALGHTTAKPDQVLNRKPQLRPLPPALSTAPSSGHCPQPWPLPSALATALSSEEGGLRHRQLGALVEAGKIEEEESQGGGQGGRQVKQQEKRKQGCLGIRSEDSTLHTVGAQ